MDECESGRTSCSSAARWMKASERCGHERGHTHDAAQVRSTPHSSSGSVLSLGKAWQSVRSCEAVSTNPALRLWSAHILAPRRRREERSSREQSVPRPEHAKHAIWAGQAARSCAAASTDWGWASNSGSGTGHDPGAGSDAGGSSGGWGAGSGGAGGGGAGAPMARGDGRFSADRGGHQHLDECGDVVYGFCPRECCPTRASTWLPASPSTTTRRTTSAGWKPPAEGERRRQRGARPGRAPGG